MWVIFADPEHRFIQSSSFEAPGSTLFGHNGKLNVPMLAEFDVMVWPLTTAESLNLYTCH